MVICRYSLFSSMPSFLDSVELRNLETVGADVLVRASHLLIAESYIKILNSQRPPYPVH